MTILPWTEQYSVEIKKIDNQHKVLLDYLNSLYEAMLLGKDNDILSEIFDGMTIYTVTHFRTEEQLMFTTGYSDYAVHKLEHQELIRQLKELRLRFNSGEPKVMIELTTFLKNWLVNHISGSDKIMGKYLIDNGVY